MPTKAFRWIFMLAIVSQGCGTGGEEDVGTLKSASNDVDGSAEKASPSLSPWVNRVRATIQEARAAEMTPQELVATRRRVQELVTHNVTRDNVHDEAARLLVGFAGSGPDGPAPIAEFVLHRVSELMREAGVREQFTARLQDSTLPQVYKRLAFEPYAKTLLLGGSPEELAQAVEVWLAAARAADRDPVLSASLLRRSGQNPALASLTGLLEHRSDADAVVREGAWWGVRNYLLSRGDDAEKRTVLDTIAALPASDLEPIALRDCLAEMRTTQANQVFLAHWIDDQEALIRYAYRQKGFADPLVLRALLRFFDANNPSVTEVQVAIQETFPAYRALAESLLGGSVEQRVLGLRLLRVFPGAVHEFRGRIAKSSAAASRAERTELAVLSEWLDESSRPSAMALGRARVSAGQP
jgi:hypothetical protein